MDKTALPFIIAMCLGIEAMAFPGTSLPARPAVDQPPYPAQSQSSSAPQLTATVWATVLDKDGQAVDKLKKEDFLVLEDGKEQAITSFAFGFRQPVSIGVLMQWSGERRDTLPLEEIDPAVGLLSSIMEKGAASFVAEFDGTVTTLTDFTTDLPQVQAALRAAATSQPPNGPSALYDSLIWACKEKLATRPQPRILLVVTDGHDNASKQSQKDAIDSAQSSQTAIYVVSLVYASPLAGHSILKECVRTARALAGETGGDAIFVHRQADLAPAFGQIERELRNQYSLGYSPVDQTGQRGFHSIQIEVKREGLRVVAPRGYYLTR